MRIPLETLAEYNDRLHKEWGPFEFQLLIRLDGLVIARAQADKKKTAPASSTSEAAAPEPIKMDNSKGLLTLFRSIGARKFGREATSD